jgi:hypothetical protein
MRTVALGKVETSRFTVGSNPFSGFSHQSREVDTKMRSYFTAEHIKQVLYDAEQLGITAMLGRTDLHIIRLLLEYWDEGGKLIWLSQTCPGVAPQETCIAYARDSGAKACHLHGGHMDWLFAQGRIDEVPPLVDLIHESGMAAGIAAHDPRVIRWAEETKLPVDYYMCSYYNSMRRDEHPEHRAGSDEWFHAEDRDTMTQLIGALSKPAIHYKVLAAGRNDPAEAFRYVARHLREQDACCVGIFPADRPEMLREDVGFLSDALGAKGQEL